MIDSLGDVGAALTGAKAESLERLYRNSDLSCSTSHKSGPTMSGSLPVWIARVSEGGLDHRFVAHPLLRVFMWGQRYRLGTEGGDHRPRP